MPFETRKQRGAGVEYETMNKAQRLVLMIGSIAVLAVALFPPWVYQLNIANVGSPRITGNYALAFSPPSQTDAAAAFNMDGSAPYMSVWLDGPRLAGELAGVVLATAGLVLAFWRRPEEKTSNSP